MSLSIESTLKLHTGNLIPRLGYGVYQARGAECEEGVKLALQAGYRQIDSAQMYRNEDIVGRAVVASKIPRSSLFLCTKYMPAHNTHGHDTIMKTIRSSVKKMDQVSEEGKGYVDMFLVHAPWGGDSGRARIWKAMAEAKEEGLTKDIGVSNYGVRHLQNLPPPVPALNQIEVHPWCQQKEVIAYCKEHDIAIQAYCPIVRADKRRFTDPTLVKICQKHDKEPAQVLVRWSLQKGYIPLPKSVTPSRIQSNADVYDFSLDDADMKALDSLDQGAKGACSWNPIDAD